MDNLNDLIVIESRPPNLAADFEKAKAQLEAELRRFDIVVTIDTLEADKKLPTEINRIKTHISTRRKDVVKEISAPIRQFDDDMKSLENMCEQRRQHILGQIQTFEADTCLIVEKLLAALRITLFAEYGVTDEFTRAEFEDLIKVTALTPGGKLKKPIVDELEARVRADKALQDQTGKRIMELENLSYKSGLKAPLTRHHIKAFLFAVDDVYRAEVDAVIRAELIREKQTEEKLREKVREEIEQENARKQAAQEKQAEPELPQPDVTPEPVAPAPTQSHAPAAPGKISCSVQCTFNIDVPPAISDTAIANELRRLLAKAGITTLQSINISRSE